MRPLLILLAGIIPLSAQETMIREVYDPKTDTHVEVLALFSAPSRGGFMPIRVKVANNLESKRSINLDFRSGSNYDYRLQARSSFSISADAGKTVTRDLMVPLCLSPTGYGDIYNVEAELSGSLGSATHTLRAETNPNIPSVLLSEALFTPNASKLDAEAKKSAGTSYGSNTFASKFDPKQLPSEWLAFSGFDSLLMTQTDWSNVPAGARNAILSWVNLGGQLVVFSSRTTTPATLGVPEDPGYGTIAIRQIDTSLDLPAKETLDFVTNHNPAGIRSLSVRNDFNTSWPLQDRFGAKPFHYGVFIVVMFIFCIIVGPVNLFVFAKSDRRHRLFITTPLISLGASLVLIAMIIFQDGFGGSGARRILMEVRPDREQNAAYIHQEQFSRTGILTTSRFTVDPACWFTPVPIAKSRWSRFTDDYNTRGTFSLQPAGGKMGASGDWWQSRSEHGHALSAVISTRGRIERTADPKTFVSTFDFPIRKLYFLDESKEWLSAENIATGKPFTVKPEAFSAAEKVIADESMAFSARNRQILVRAKNRTGHFVALTEQAPGIDTYTGIRWQETRTVITGPVVKH